jgi:hypothetical protein
LWFARQKAAPRGLAIPGHCGIYLLALLTKETGAMLLPLYGGFAFFCLGYRWRDFRRNGAIYAGMLATLGVYLAMRIHALGSLAPAQQTFFHLGPAEFLFSAVVTAAQYLGALVWPAHLNYFHIFHPTESVMAWFLVSALVLSAVVAAFFRLRATAAAYGIFWVAVTLAPVLNLTGLGQNVFTERYLYLPSAGFCWIAAWAWNCLANRGKALAWATAAAVLVACGIGTLERNRDWLDDATLLRVTLAQSPSSGWLHNSMAGVYVEQGEFENALAEERLAVWYEPRSPVYRKNLGNILLAIDPRAAVDQFEKLVAMEPGRAESHCDLALALEAEGETTGAAAEYKRALALEPQSHEAREGYGRTSGKAR